MQVAELQDVLAKTPLQKTLLEYCLSEFHGAEGEFKVNMMIPNGIHRLHAVNKLSSLQSWTENDARDFLMNFQQAQVSQDIFIEWTSNSFSKHHLANCFYQVTMKKMVAVKDWHPSWSSLTYRMVNLIKLYASAINQWYENRGESGFPKISGILIPGQSGVYHVDLWLNTLTPEHLENFVKFLSNCKVNDIADHRFDLFWEQWTALELMPYLYGMKSPSLLKQPCLLPQARQTEIRSPDLAPLSVVEQFLRSIQIDAPAFVAEYHRLDLDLEDLGDAVEGFSDPDLDGLRRLLTLKQRMKIKRMFTAKH